MQTHVEFNIDEQGDLIISLPEANKAAFYEDFGLDTDTHLDSLILPSIWDVCESYFCNGYKLLTDEDKESLGLDTACDIIARWYVENDEAVITEVNEVYVWGALFDPVYKLLENGSVCFALETL